MTPKRITLEAFVRRYSEANQTPLEMMEAGTNRLRTDSEGYRLDKAARDAFREYEEFLIAAGFDW